MISNQSERWIRFSGIRKGDKFGNWTSAEFGYSVPMTTPDFSNGKTRMVHRLRKPQKYRYVPLRDGRISFNVGGIEVWRTR